MSQGTVPTQAELLKLWDINEEAAAPPATTVKLPVAKPAVAMTDAINAMANTVRDAMIAAIDIATGAPIAVKSKSTVRQAKTSHRQSRQSAPRLEQRYVPRRRAQRQRRPRRRKSPRPVAASFRSQRKGRRRAPV